MATMPGSWVSLSQESLRVPLTAGRELRVNNFFAQRGTISKSKRSRISKQGPRNSLNHLAFFRVVKTKARSRVIFDPRNVHYF